MTTTARKAWEGIYSSPAAVTPLEPLPAAIGWIRDRALLSSDSEGLPNNFFHVSFPDKQHEKYMRITK
jgi:hypothetical protein